MKHQQRIAYAHEALDRIHVVQTLLASILVDTHHHKGLCDNAVILLDGVQDGLQDAYKAQSEYLWELEEKE
jgi:allantoicase